MKHSVSPVKYLYIDDDDSASTFSSRISDVFPEFSTEPNVPGRFEDEIDRLSSDDFSFAGLLIDLRLDQNPVHKVQYWASAVAAQLRDLAGDYDEEKGAFKALSYPVVLYTSEENYHRSYKRDAATLDLFDDVILKGEVAKSGDAAQYAGVRLQSLANDYPELHQAALSFRKASVESDEPAARDKSSEYVRSLVAQTIARLLGFDNEEQAAFLDAQVFNYLSVPESEEDIEEEQATAPTDDLGEALPPPTAHQLARFVLDSLLRPQGPLIDIEILAARLGIDRDASGDFEKVIGAFAVAQYSGVFAGGWPRWWAYRLLEIWKALVPQAPPLRTLTAQERVAALKAALQLDGLVAASPVSENYDTRFWAICRGTKKPIAPQDAFLLRRASRGFPWQSQEYASLEAFLKRLVSARDIDPVDESRLRLAVESAQTKNES